MQPSDKIETIEDDNKKKVKFNPNPIVVMVNIYSTTNPTQRSFLILSNEISISGRENA